MADIRFDRCFAVLRAVNGGIRDRAGYHLTRSYFHEAWTLSPFPPSSFHVRWPASRVHRHVQDVERADPETVREDMRHADDRYKTELHVRVGGAAGGFVEIQVWEIQIFDRLDKVKD